MAATALSSENRGYERLSVTLPEGPYRSLFRGAKGPRSVNSPSHLKLSIGDNQWISLRSLLRIADRASAERRDHGVLNF